MSDRLEKNISKTEHPHRDLSTALRFGRDDKGERGASREESSLNGSRFSSAWVGQRPMNPRSNLRTEQQLVLQKPINRRDLLQSAAALLGTTATSGLATAVAGAAVTQGDAGQSTGKPTTIVASDEDAIAETACGKVRGYIRDGIFTYKGIPYGDSPAVSGRFQPPQKAKPWT